jgi:drug/metabolite transporter (DMT)-like permease
VLGAIAGLVGFAPYLLVERRIRARAENRGTRSIQMGCLGAVISFAVMVALLVAGRFLMSEWFLLFALGCLGAFLVCMVIYLVTLIRGQGGRKNERRELKK